MGSQWELGNSESRAYDTKQLDGTLLGKSPVKGSKTANKETETKGVYIGKQRLSRLSNYCLFGCLFVPGTQGRQLNVEKAAWRENSRGCQAIQ